MRIVTQIIVLLFVSISLSGCRCSQKRHYTGDGSTRPPITITWLVQKEDYDLQRELEKGYSHIESVNVIDSVRSDINRRCLLVEKEVSSFFQSQVLTAYNTERDAFSEWQSFQDTIANDAMHTMWVLYIGGNAVMDLMVGHLFNVARINLADQSVLLAALEREPRVDATQYTATPDQILQAKERVRSDYDFASMSGANELKGLEIWKAKEVVDKDFTLFTIWISQRRALESVLPDYCKDYYASSTNYWMYFYYKHYEERLLTDPIK